MYALRRLVMNHRHLAACLVLMALCVKIFVPTGFMTTVSGDTITVSLCSGTGPQTMAVEIPGLAGTPDHDDGSKDHHKSPMPCAFAGLGLASTGAIDPVILDLAIAFVMVAGFAAVVRRPAAVPAYLRPPSRGPPATI